MLVYCTIKQAFLSNENMDSVTGRDMCYNLQSKVSKEAPFMLKVYNKSAITRKQRFSNALVVGLGAALVSVLAIFLFHRMGFFLDIFYVVAGYGIGYVICRYGKGVQIQFAVLALVLTIAVILIGDGLLMGGLTIFKLYFAMTDPIETLFFIGYRVAACIIAWSTSRIAS